MRLAGAVHGEKASRTTTTVSHIIATFYILLVNVGMLFIYNIAVKLVPNNLPYGKIEKKITKKLELKFISFTDISPVIVHGLINLFTYSATCHLITFNSLKVHVPTITP
jgi:CDP-diglyceride synthetase